MPRLAGRKAADMVADMQAFKTGQKDSTVMGRIAKGLTDAEIEAIAAWYAACAGGLVNVWVGWAVKAAGCAPELSETEDAPLEQPASVARIIRDNMVRARFFIGLILAQNEKSRREGVKDWMGWGALLHRPAIGWPVRSARPAGGRLPGCSGRRCW